jgi:glycolate oxidase
MVATSPAAASPELVRRMAAVVGERNCISDPAGLLVYECDGLTHGRTRPALVVLPGSTEEVVAVVKLAGEAGLPIVPRGAGTGLSGGARPTPGSIVVGLSRMKRILAVDLENGTVRV